MSSSSSLNRDYLIRIKTIRNRFDYERKSISLRIFDETDRTSEELFLDKSSRTNGSSDRNQIDEFRIRTKEKLTENLQRLKLHTKNIGEQKSSNDRLFLEWIELKDLISKRTFCFPVDDYLPSSSGDALELTEFHRDQTCEDKTSPSRSNTSQKRYDIRTKTGHQGFLGIRSLIKANVFLRLIDVNNRSSETFPLNDSRLHEHPFRSNQTDQFEMITGTKLGPLKKVELWHDGKKGTKLHCDTLEITDRENGQIYCFQIKEYLENDTKLVLTDYDDRQCLDSTRIDRSQSINDDNDERESTTVSTRSTRKNLAPLSQSSRTSSNSTANQTLYKVRTRVGHKGFLSLGMGGTNANVFIRLHDKDKISDDVLLNNSFTHNNPFEAGHTDVFEIGVSLDIESPDQIEIFHNGKKHDGLYLKWIEIMNMKTLERKCFPVNRWLDSNEGDRKTHITLTGFTVDESCEENEYREHHVHDQLKSEYVVRTKTSKNQPMNSDDHHANIYLKIYNDKNKHTEDMLLSNSKHHSNPFRPGQIDKFEIGSVQQMDDTIDKIELWHDNKTHFNWFCQWIEIKNKKTGSIKCFGVNRLLSRKSSDGATKIVLTVHSHYPCEKIEHELDDLAKNRLGDDRSTHREKILSNSPQRHSTNDDFKKKFIVKVKTGNKMLSATDADVFIRLYDEKNRLSEEIPLRQTVTNKRPFGKNSIDEFHVGTRNNLSDLSKVHLWHEGGANDGWNVQWLQIEDIDANRLYCFPVNKWLDSNSNDRTRQIVLDEFSVNEPCSSLNEHKQSSKVQKSPMLRNNDRGSEFKRTFHVETKTGKKGFLGLSPTGTNANVFIRIHDENGRVSEPIELQRSLKHRNKFERGQTDEFEIGSTQSLTNIDKLEVWHDGNGLGHGWFADYISITDNKTGEETCFPIEDYLNEENGGVETKHLIINKQFTDDRPCREQNFDGTTTSKAETNATGNLPSAFTQTYRVETKTGHAGLFGLAGSGTNAPVFIRIHDNNDQFSEPIQLKHSLRHRNKFERNQTDLFDVGTRKSLDGIKRLELWHEGDKNDGWQVEHVEIFDNKTGDSYCFPVNAMLDKNSGLKKTHVLLENPSVNVPCPDSNKSTKKIKDSTGKDEKIRRNFTIRTKTGSHVEAGSTTPIHVQLFDDQNEKSEDIRLKHHEHHKHNFEPDAIDEFEVTSSQPLSDRLVGIRVKHNADKYQGWYAEWIEVIDEDYRKSYCFPIQRWLDKGEDDKQTNVYFDRISSTPCDQLPNSMADTDPRLMTTNRERAARRTGSLQSPSLQSSTRSIKKPFQNSYHVKTKTARKGVLGLSPTGTNANVFIRIKDKNGRISEDLQLTGSTDHKNSFERGQIDEFDVGTSENLKGIDSIELWTDGKGLGNGWFPEFIELTDNKTGDVSCFAVNQYLNEKNGGVEDRPLRLTRASDDRLCQGNNGDNDDDDDENQTESSSRISNRNVQRTNDNLRSRYTVTTKTGHTGFLGLGGSGTNAPVFIRIRDNKDKVSEPIQLKHSTRHRNKFERNQTDLFDVGSSEILDGISSVELWHEGDKYDGWQVDYVQIFDHQTNTSYCFPVNAMLDQNSGLKRTHVFLDQPMINASCPEQTDVLKQSPLKTKNDQNQRHFSIRTKTGDHIEAGSTTPIHVQLFDDQNQKSEDIRLKHHDHDKHNFEPDAIDEFEVTSDEPLSNRLVGIRVKHNADKYQGWYCEWIEITDEDYSKKYCFPIQRWLDKAEDDRKTNVYFTDVSDVPCDSLPNTMPVEVNRRPMGSTRQGRETQSKSSMVSSIASSRPFQNTYHVETKTGKKGFLGLSPTGTNADVFIRLIDRQGTKSDVMELKSSTDHRNKFERGQTDEFDVGTEKRLNGVQQLEIWTDSSGLGHGWFADHVIVTDNKTGEESCFLIGEYLNKQNGGVTEKHLIVNKQLGNVSCREKRSRNDNDDDDDDLDTIETRRMKAVKSHRDSAENSTSTVVYKRTYHIDTKTGRKGFLGLSPTGTNADVHLRLHDKLGQRSEPISLRRSTKHSNPFEKGKLDSFDVGVTKSLESLSKIELYHDGTGLGHGWNVEYVNVLDNSTGHSYCFPIKEWINNGEHVIIDDFVRDRSCDDAVHHRNSTKTNDTGKRNFTIRTKTGSQVEAGSTTPLHIRLFDDQMRKSEKIRLKDKDKDGHHFKPNSIDEFQISTDKPLSSLIGIEVSHSADKFQGWYGEWISVTDNETNETSCFPLQRWLDKGEMDGKTEIYLKRIQMSDACDQLPDTMKRQSQLKSQPNQRSARGTSLSDQIKSNFHVETKTAKKGFLGLSPTGTDANVFVRLHDRNGKISEPIQLKHSSNHKNSFGRGKIDDFDVGSREDLGSIDKIELWTDGKGIGSGWFPEYLRLTDEKTGETSCFPIEQYLNEKNGGVKDEHLFINKQNDSRICGDLNRKVLNKTNENDIESDRTKSLAQDELPGRFEIEIKTGHNGFLGLSGAGTDAPAFIRLYDRKNQETKPIQLKNSTRHRNKFERNQTDRFVVDSDEPLVDISKVDLWHEGDKNDGWKVNYLNVFDRQTNTSYCFPVNAMLDENSGLNRTQIRLEKPLINVQCHLQNEPSKHYKSERTSKNFTVRTKTGDDPSAGSTTPIHLQLIDVNDDKSKDVRLKKKDAEGHHFAPGSVDEFKVNLSEPLSRLKAVKLSVDADRYQGWYGEWISVTDDETQETFCFPIQRWLDKGEQDHKTQVIFHQQSKTLCRPSIDSMSNNTDEFVKYQIRTKTADRSLKGKTNRPARVFLNVFKSNGEKIGGPIQLNESKNQKNPFQRHQTDRFEIEIPNVKTSQIDRLDLYHDGQNDGWFCDFVELKNLRTKETKCFSVHQWLDENSTENQFSVTNYQTVSCETNDEEKR